MGSAISQTIIRDELEKLKEALDNNNLSDVTEQSRINLNLLKNTTLDIAITGASGTGKSSFVNALRGMTDYEEGAAETGGTQTTVKAKGYPHPTFPKVTIWDLPGIETPDFEPDKYLKKVNFRQYDFFIIVASNRFTTNDVLLAHEILKMKKKFYYVRTNVDVSIRSERRKPNFNEEKTLMKIRKYCCAGLIKVGEYNPKVFLTSRWDLNLYDFPLLRETLENDLDDLKRYALITTMPNFSREILRKKKVVMEALIWQLSLVSCVIGTIPVPGLSLVCDLGILVETMRDFCKVFGLDDESLKRLADRTGKPVPVLRSAIKKSRMANHVTPDFVKGLLSKSIVCGAMMAVEFVFGFIPGLGSVFGGISSFATTFYMLKSFLNDVVEDAEDVLAKAAENLESRYKQRPRTSIWRPDSYTTMAFAFTKEAIRKEFEKLKNDLENRNLEDAIQQSEKYLDLVKNSTLDIAITGDTGAGKSSLVNALRGMTDSEEGAAETGETQTTMERMKYSHPSFPNVTIWDLPGIGTTDFEPKDYLKKVHFKEYDFFVIVASNRFTTNDVLLAREILKMKKKFYYVRTKVDVSIDSERRKPNFCKAKCLDKIREYCCDNLAKAGESNPLVFLISRWDLDIYDFPRLQMTLENDLDDLKKYALIASMPAFSREVLEKKKAAMESLIWKVSLVSCGIGAIPVPGLSLVCDIGILVATMRYFCKVFGLDEDSLCRLASRVGKPLSMLRSAIKKSPMASQVTTEFVIDLLTKSLLCGTMMAVEFALDFVPVLGSLTGGGLSFVTTFYILKSFLHDVEEDAENVRAKAVES
ncbi:uncharacterized protein LOC129342969 [Eublepharis macularius]|uniref:Uncharacterized protein LOC129342969 n=1 Tax=Eublepharis macularius TaxID=481883 RepID=A0AA97KFQ2_EUBMA|nr:uncharacterized protein LOC129342969 [Eublepharis macularius]